MMLDSGHFVLKEGMKVMAKKLFDYIYTRW